MLHPWLLRLHALPPALRDARAGEVPSDDPAWREMLLRRVLPYARTAQGVPVQPLLAPQNSKRSSHGMCVGVIAMAHSNRLVSRIPHCIASLTRIHENESIDTLSACGLYHAAKMGPLSACVCPDASASPQRREVFASSTSMELIIAIPQAVRRGSTTPRPAPPRGRGAAATVSRSMQRGRTASTSLASNACLRSARSRRPRRGPS